MVLGTGGEAGLGTPWQGDISGAGMPSRGRK